MKKLIFSTIKFTEDFVTDPHPDPYQNDTDPEQRF
jgi:hypothetical protein